MHTPQEMGLGLLELWQYPRHINKWLTPSSVAETCVRKETPRGVMDLEVQGDKGSRHQITPQLRPWEKMPSINLTRREGYPTVKMSTMESLGSTTTSSSSPQLPTNADSAREGEWLKLLGGCHTSEELD